MPRLLAVEIAPGPLTEIRFTLSRTLFEACDTAVLELIDGRGSGSEVVVRVERGLITDVSVWDAELRMRRRLPTAAVTVDGECVTCSVPAAMLPHPEGGLACMTAALIVNGTRVQSGFAVSVAAPPPTGESIAAPPVPRV
jgi:hypothetical protein